MFDKRFYQMIMQGASLALGETFMARWWDAEKPDQLFERIFQSNLEEKIKSSWPARWLSLKSAVLNRQTSARAYTVGKKHYDIGNELYVLMLDPTMSYSCGYWSGANNLEQAQLNKLDLICRKLRLKPGMKFLDIGCGWGSLVKFACENYGVKASGITISKEQLKLAKQRCRKLPIDLKLQDYRDLTSDQTRYDAVASVGMIEHVGCKNYHEFMKTVNHCLKPDALCLLHTIGNNISENHTDPWIEKYIFPNSMLPSLAQISRSCENVLSIVDLHNFGPDYDHTLISWYHNFVENWDKLKHKYDQRFFRMWKYYLLTSAAGFRTRRMQLWQILLTKTHYRPILETLR